MHEFNSLRPFVGIDPGWAHVAAAMMSGDYYADITDRLRASYGAQVPLELIARVILQCHAELSSAPPRAKPALLEHLAGIRLRALPGHRPHTPGNAAPWVPQ